MMESIEFAKCSKESARSCGSSKGLVSCVHFISTYSRLPEDYPSVIDDDNNKLFVKILSL